MQRDDSSAEAFTRRSLRGLGGRTTGRLDKNKIFCFSERTVVSGKSEVSGGRDLGVDLYLELHAGICHAAFEHGGGRGDVLETAAEAGPALGEIALVGQQVADPDDVRERASGLGER